MSKSLIRTNFQGVYFIESTFYLMMLSDDKKDTRVSSYYRTSILKYDENMLQTDVNESLYSYLFIRKLIKYREIKRFICFDKGATMILVATNCY